MEGDDRLVAELAKRALAADLGRPVAEVDAVLAEPRLSLAAAGLAALIAERWVPVARAVLEGVRAAEVAADHESAARSRGARPGDLALGLGAEGRVRS